VNTSRLHPGDVVEARVQGKIFQARVVGAGEGLAVGTIKVAPVEDWPTWRFLRPRQIVRKVELQERLGVSL
jgi:hypothetical protein